MTGEYANVPPTLLLVLLLFWLDDLSTPSLRPSPLPLPNCASKYDGGTALTPMEPIPISVFISLSTRGVGVTVPCPHAASNGDLDPDLNPDAEPNPDPNPDPDPDPKAPTRSPSAARGNQSSLISTLLTVLSFRTTSSLNPFNLPQNHATAPPSTTTLMHASTIPAMAPALSPAECCCPGAGALRPGEEEDGDEGDEEEGGVSPSAGNGSPGESWYAALRARSRWWAREVVALGLMTATMPWPVQEEGAEQ